MLNDEQKHSIEVYLTEREKGFAARQELMIHDRVSRELKALEDARRGRLQFFTAVGGAGLLAIAVLLWESISNTAVNAAAKEVAASKEQFNALVAEMERHSEDAEDAVRQARAAENNVNARLKLVDQQLLEIDRALGEISTAEGQVSYLTEMVQLRTSLASIEASLNDLKQGSGSGTGTAGNPSDAAGLTTEDYFRQQQERQE